MVPNFSFPESRRYFISGTDYDSHINLNKVKYEETGKPVKSLKSPYFFLNYSQICLVLVSHHTMALYNGFPVSSQHTTVSRWLQMPNPWILDTSNPSYLFSCSLLSTLSMASWVFCSISMGSCSSQPSCGVICLCWIISLSTSFPLVSKTENLVEVVDWSIEAT